MQEVGVEGGFDKNVVSEGDPLIILLGMVGTNLLVPNDFSVKCN